MSHNHDAFVYDGHQHYLAGRFNEALQSFDEAKREAPDDPQIYYWQGYVHLAMKQVQPALAAWEQAASLAPDDSGIYLAMAGAYRQIGQDKNAHELQEMVSRFPGDGVSREIALGLLAIQRKDFQEALGHYERAAQHRPGSAFIAGYVGHAQLLLGRNREARASYLLATRDAMAAPVAFYNLAIAEARLRDHSAAAQSLELALEADGSYQKAYLKLSSVEVRLGRLRSAWGHFRKAYQCVSAAKK